MNTNTTRWILAFDSTCGTCRRVAATVADAVGEQLEVLPLNHPDVLGWRRQALGERAPSVPTLVRVAFDNVRAWTGVGMGVVLMRTLGARTTLAVLNALGELSAKPKALPRKGFLKLAAGVAVAGGMVLTGRTPALAQQQGPSEVETWLDHNRERLPTTFRELTAKPMAYRRAIYDASPAEVRRSFWLEHFDTYEAARPGLTRAQRDVLAQCRRLVTSTTELFGQRPRAEVDREGALGTLAEAARQAFGEDEAKALLVQLGPDDPIGAELVECDCALGDPNWCGPTCHACCYQQLGCGCTYCCCVFRDSGCGSLWEYACDGWCY